MFKIKRTSFGRIGTDLVGICGIVMAMAQPAFCQSDNQSLNDLSSFTNPGKTWSLGSSVSADLNKPNFLSKTEGTGILINLPDKKNQGSDLFSKFEHGDMDLELDYMLAKGSNSGIYLQGRYELQLEDSWGIKSPTSANNGGMYVRWDDSKPEGHQGYQGYPPRQNASRAPGVWQHIKISFQAPRFDAAGKKISNAKMVKVELNGVLIHENLELLGPTRGAISNDEKATGPLRLQGDHGAIAFKNIKVKLYDKPREEVTNNGGNNTDPILIDAPVNTVLRSFMDLPGFKRVVHAVSVGSPEQVHYTYDMDNGAVVQVWRGGFLDATPMWHDRGDGSSRPVGVVQRFGKPVLSLAKLASPQTAWITDTAGTGFRQKGYVLDEADRPTFRYLMYGTMVNDQIRALDNGQGIHREITVENAPENLYLRVAEGSDIESISNGLYLVDGKSYYLRLDDDKGAKPVIREAGGRKELILPVKGKVGYAILF